MKSTNKIFAAALIALLTIVITLSWQFLQSEIFGEFASSHLGRFAREKLGLELRFERVELSLIPMQTSLINLEMEGGKANVRAGRLTLGFGVRDILSKRFSIGSVVLKNAVVNLVGKKSQKKREFSLPIFFKEYQKTFFDKSSFRIRGIEVKSSLVQYEKMSAEVFHFKSRLYRDILTAQVELEVNSNMLKPLGLSSLEKAKINGAFLDIQMTNQSIRLKKGTLFSEDGELNTNFEYLSNGDIKDGYLKGVLNFDSVRHYLPRGDYNPEILPAGTIGLNFNFLKKRSGFEFSGKISGDDIHSPFYKYDKLTLYLSTRGQRVFVDKGWGEINSGRVELKNSFAVLDLNHFRFINPVFDVKLSSLSSGDFLFFVRALDDVHFTTQGRARLIFSDGQIKILPYDNLSLQNFKLFTKDQSLIVSHDNVFFKKGGGIRVLYSGKVFFKNKVFFDTSILNMDGFVDGERVDINVDGSLIDFLEVGPIMGTSLKGRGKVEGRVSGLLDDVVFDLIMGLDKFSILGFEFGHIDGGMKYHLGKSLMELRNLRGNYKSLKYKGGGDLIFNSLYDNQIDMMIDIEKGRLEDAKVGLFPIVNPLAKYLKNVRFDFSSKILMRGKMAIPKMDVRGELKANNIMIGSEDIDFMDSNFQLKNNILSFYNIKLKKSSGRGRGEGKYNLGTRDFSYKGKVKNLRLKDIFYYRTLSLGLDGDVVGDFYGAGKDDDFSSQSHVKILNSSIENLPIDDSFATLYNDNTDLFFSGSFIGSSGVLEGYLNLMDDQEKLSTITGRIQTEKLKILAGILSKHNILNKELDGEIDTTFQLDFNLFKIEEMNFKGTLGKARIAYKDIALNIGDRPLNINIEKGEFKNWNYTLKGKGIELHSLGRGNLAKSFNLTHHFNFNSSWVELLTDKGENILGSLKGDHILSRRDGLLSQHLSLYGDDLTFKLKGIPGLVTNFKFNMIMKNDKLTINEARGKYGDGEVKGSGEIYLRFPFPKIDLNLDIEKARYFFLNKSSVVVSGDLHLYGERLPYDIGGDLVIIKGDVLEETNDLASSAINNDSYQRFIPVGYLEGNVSFLRSDMRIRSLGSIHIKNGMMNLGLLGNIRIFGSVTTPKFKGELSLDNRENKFIFKGHEFLLSEGVIRFVDGARKERPELQFSGMTHVDDYDVFVSLNGAVDSLVVEMSSNPPLSHEDILSLLTLGVTSDVSKSLGDRQRQSVTTLSIGSLLMDQLKIGQSLSEGLGLSLSVSPEFEEDEDNLLEGRVDDSSSSSKLRSATVVKVQKKINKEMNLSVSQTVGGNIDQSQEMKLNYKINKAWSLEGIYEVKSNDELEQQVPNSVGADIKYQWSF